MKNPAVIHPLGKNQNFRNPGNIPGLRLSDHFLLLPFQIIVRNSRGAIRNIDDSAALKAQLFDRALHHMVILVGIDPQMTDFSCRKGDSRFQNPSGTVSRNAMDGTVWRIRAPSAAVDSLVGWVFSYPEEENTVYALPVRYDKQPVLRNVLPKLRRGRIGFAPLIWISVFVYFEY